MRKQTATPTVMPPEALPFKEKLAAKPEAGSQSNLSHSPTPTAIPQGGKLYTHALLTMMRATISALDTPRDLGISSPKTNVTTVRPTVE